jgi:hypothetical protein
MDILDRATGALMGMAVGEALGAPLEGLSPDEIEQKVGRVRGFLDAADTQPKHRSGYFAHSAYEDETQAALATAETLVRNDGFKVEQLKSRLEELGQPVDGNVFGCYRRAQLSHRGPTHARWSAMEGVRREHGGCGRGESRHSHRCVVPRRSGRTTTGEHRGDVADPS